MFDASKYKLLKQSEDTSYEKFENNGYNILKWVVAKDLNGLQVFIFELNMDSDKELFRLRIETFIMSQSKSPSRVQSAYSTSGLDIYNLYQHHLKPYLNEKKFALTSELPDNVHGSIGLQKLVWKSKISTNNDGTFNLSKTTAQLVKTVWNSAVGNLSDLFEEPEDDIFAKLTSEMINNSECILQKQREELEKPNNTRPVDYSYEFYKSLPFKDVVKTRLITNRRNLSLAFETCQLLRDIISISESSDWNLRPSIHSKYRSIGAYISPLHKLSQEYLNVSNNISLSGLFVANIFEVVRPNEYFQFAESISDRRLLYHGSKLSNFLGILSRGLMLPKCVTNEYGEGMRTDVGSLGAGIYFAEKIDVSLGYCKREVSGVKDSFLVCVCEVALGACKEYYEVNNSLVRAPEGFQSCCGVGGTNAFAENEYVVYETKQCRIKYLIELKCTEEDLVGEVDLDDVQEENSGVESSLENNNDDNDFIAKDGKKEVTSGLKSDSGEDLPLRSVHVRAKLIDMIGQVTIYQEYENTGTSTIEARYVFPLSDTACVCGFEAFINEKHLVGVCKEKQQARREYKEAIEQGKGAYLMDQETVEMFTVNVGNLPPNARLTIF